MSDTFKQMSDALAQTVEATRPALVSVDARRRMPATGIVWSEDVIITAHHVVERDEALRVMVGDETHEAQLIGRDPGNDLAVLKVEGASLTPAQWAEDEALAVGHLVLALGRPTEQVQATLGVVSALVAGGRHAHEGKRKRHGGRHGRGRRMGRILAGGYIQTDVTMYPGFSGGALVSGDGRVHGLNTSGFGQGASIAVPVASIRKTIAVLMAHGRMRQGYIGVGIQPARLAEANATELEQEVGLLVVSVEAGSPAHQAGVLVGDILTALDGDSLTQPDELMMLLSGDRIGQEAELQLVRGGKVETLTVTIGDRD